MRCVIPGLSFLLLSFLLLFLTAAVFILGLICGRSTNTRSHDHTRAQARAHTHTRSPRPQTADRTFLPALLAAAVQVVLELDPHLPLVGLVSDEGVLQELVGGRPLRVVLHQTALDEAEELLGPENKITGERF